MNLLRSLALVSASLATNLVFSASVLALNLSEQTNTNRPVNVGISTQASNGPKVQKGLAVGKLEACQAKEAELKQRSTKLIDLITQMEARFEGIATQTENYYVNKVVPAGKAVISNDSLVAATQTQRANVMATLGKAQADVNNFSCSSADPKAQLIQFKQDMQTVKTALKRYRTAIKNLIVAVHTAGGTSNQASPAASPKKQT